MAETLITTLKFDPKVHGMAIAAGKLLQPKEHLYQFVDQAVRERLARLAEEGKIPAGLTIPEA